jgi:hypothetical protein
MRRKFESRTDHNGLKYSFEQQTLNVRKTRWLEFMSEYDFDIKHINDPDYFRHEMRAIMGRYNKEMHRDITDIQ